MNEHFDMVIKNYEEKLQEQFPDYKMSKADKLLLRECMIYGYNYARQEQTIQKLYELPLGSIH